MPRWVLNVLRCSLAVALFACAAPSVAQQSSYVLDLRTLMDNHYGAGNWSYYTGQGTGTDIGPALQDGISQIQAIPFSNRAGEIDVGPFSWSLKTQVSDFGGIIVRGVTSSRSVIVFQNAGAVAFYFKTVGGGLRHLAILLDSGLGDTLSMAVLLAGNATSQPDQTEFEDLYISAVGGLAYWWDAVHVDGTARTAPIGARVVTWKNIQTFNARNLSVYLGGAIKHTFENLGCYTGKGPYANTIMISGTAAAPSINNTLISVTCGVVHGNDAGTSIYGN